MQSLSLGRSELSVSRLAYGCMRIVGDGSIEARKKGTHAVHAAVDAGYTLFDHADIYAAGESERLFGEILKASPTLRDQVVIASKCGIRFANEATGDPARYDFSADYVATSVNNSLRRLQVEQLDLLLLHRPDYLMDAVEVAHCLQALKDSGKVARFGVSNFSTSQLELLQSAFAEPLLVNQLEINLHNVNALGDGTLDQCQRLGVIPQAWCPLAAVAYEAWGNTFDEQAMARLTAELTAQSHKYDVATWVIALAWLLIHPANIAPIIGSTSPERIAQAVSALDVPYDRSDWYRLFEARNGQPVP